MRQTWYKSDASHSHAHTHSIHTHTHIHTDAQNMKDLWFSRSVTRMALLPSTATALGLWKRALAPITNFFKKSVAG